MSVMEEVAEFLEKVSIFAGSVRRKIGWFLAITLVISLVYAWKLYSPESDAGWNVFKCVLVLLPSLVWLVIWLLLGQLQEAPELASTFVSDKDNTISNLHAQLQKPKFGVASLIKSVTELRDNEGFETVTDSLASFTLLANPVFLLISAIMLVILLLFLFIAPFILIF